MESFLESMPAYFRCWRGAYGQLWLLCSLRLFRYVGRCSTVKCCEGLCPNMRVGHINMPRAHFVFRLDQPPRLHLLFAPGGSGVVCQISGDRQYNSVAGYVFAVAGLVFSLPFLCKTSNAPCAFDVLRFRNRLLRRNLPNFRGRGCLCACV